MKERDLYPVIQRWLRINMIGKSGAVEVKLCKTKSLPYSEIYEHQVRNLELAECTDKVFTWKAPDDSRGEKPFDIFFYSGAHSYLCIVFYTMGCKRFYMIDVDRFKLVMDNSNRKSITEDECKELASHSFIVGGK